ncbi:MAG: HAD-IA family hydrolase [Rhodobacteraceae bacterium]|nr:HAD-IA family hydrolase [Paracoccaceae bacterium]
MTPKAVIFDCDGVLVDSEPLTDAIIAANLTRHGLPMSEDRVHTLFIGGTIEGLGQQARDMGARLSDTWINDIYAEIFARLAKGTPLIEGVSELLDRLDAARIPYAVGSNGSRRKMEVTLGQHPGVYARLRNHLYSRHDVGAPKPDPALYLHAARQLGHDPADCVVIEDSATGCRAAARAGIRCYGFAPSGVGEQLAAEGAVIFRKMRDLPGLFGL